MPGRDGYRREGDAAEFFGECRNAVRKLRALNERLDDMADNGYLRAITYGPRAAGGPGESRVERDAMQSDALYDEIRRCADRYAELLFTAQAAVSEMEADGADAEGDVALLDYYYLQAKSVRECARLMGYSESWVRHKKALALVHVAPYAPRSW